jgi:hypothetical protein
VAVGCARSTSQFDHLPEASLNRTSGFLGSQFQKTPDES